jgi:ornithine cyclodeaminase/alanine dehydrogenase-like protein (mu-crystallin family)
VSSTASDDPLFLTEKDVQARLRFEALIPAIEQALTDFSAGRFVQPVRTILSLPEQAGHPAWFGLMPALCGQFLGAKLVTVYPGNASRALPTHNATIVLFRSDTGQPLAVLDGRLITEMRTAAVSAVATRALTAPSANRLAILGSGVQARSHLEALRLVRDFTHVAVWSRNPDHAGLFAAETGASPALTAEDAVRDADVVVTVTSAPEPILRGEWLKPGAYVNAVGSVGLARRELDVSVFDGAAVVVESRQAALQESGEVITAGATIHGEIGEILSGGKRLPPANRVVFKSLGIAAEDITAAALVYQTNISSV